jgi:hypothetical protein
MAGLDEHGRIHHSPEKRVTIGSGDIREGCEGRSFVLFVGMATSIAALPMLAAIVGE